MNVGNWPGSSQKRLLLRAIAGCIRSPPSALNSFAPRSQNSLKPGRRRWRDSVPQHRPRRLEELGATGRHQRQAARHRTGQRNAGPAGKARWQGPPARVRQPRRYRRGARSAGRTAQGAGADASPDGGQDLRGQPPAVAEREDRRQLAAAVGTPRLPRPRRQTVAVEACTPPSPRRGLTPEARRSTVEPG